MTPVFFLLLVLLLTAVPPGAADDGAQTDTSSAVAEIIERANAQTKTRLMHGDIRPNLNRNAGFCTAIGCKWPKRGRYVQVPVAISSRYTTEERNTIIQALQTFHQSTCIRFVKKSWWHWNFLYFYSGDGCWSFLGRQLTGQLVSLNKNGCLFKSTIQHEALHALGFHHEHVRSDRDSYISILTQNIKFGLRYNFFKVNTNNLGTPYDFNSVMHYDKYAFSKNGLPTITAKKDPNLSFGHATEMSANDIARVNRLYKCCE